MLDIRSASTGGRLASAHSKYFEARSVLWYFSSLLCGLDKSRRWGSGLVLKVNNYYVPLNNVKVEIFLVS